MRRGWGRGGGKTGAGASFAVFMVQNPAHPLVLLHDSHSTDTFPARNHPFHFF